jgi:hypothetical protein
MLTELEPELKEQKQAAGEKSVQIAKEKKIADEQEKIVAEESEEVNIQAMKIKGIKDKVELQLEEAKPAMEEAK